ncbi:hypothetical protein MXD61_27060 [Frankia sp. AgPm24]|nr:hypothetical protein [Frankia sp. AgPm24]
MATDITPHPDEELARQPAGYWTGAAHRTIVGRIRAELAVDDLTQPRRGAAPPPWSRSVASFSGVAGVQDAHGSSWGYSRPICPPQRPV